MEIKIDVSDWHERVMRNESVIRNEDDLFNQVDKGMRTSEIAQSVLISRELEYAPEDIIRSNKLLLKSGAMVDVSAKIASAKHEVQTEKGATYEARSYVGGVRVEDGNGHNDTGFYQAVSDGALERAEHYICNVVPGHIWSRLLIIYENGGDIGEAVAKLLVKIVDMEKRLE